MTAGQPVLLEGLSAAAEQGWHVLFDLAGADSTNWVLVGGQMVYLLAIENGVPPIRATEDVDVVVDVRARPDATRWLAAWLVTDGFRLKSLSAEGIGHRFVKQADPGPGLVTFDVLAPDGLGERTSRVTSPPARTVEAPGATQALSRSELIDVTVTGYTSSAPRNGKVRRPTVLGALVSKAAATTIAVRYNPERDWEDAALLLSLLDDPVAIRVECTTKDLQRLRRLVPLIDEHHPAWAVHSASAARRGRDALGFLIG